MTRGRRRSSSNDLLDRLAQIQERWNRIVDDDLDETLDDEDIEWLLENLMKTEMRRRSVLAEKLALHRKVEFLQLSEKVEAFLGGER